MEKRHGGLSVLCLCLLCAGALAWLPFVAADSAWHPNPHGIGSNKASSSLHGTLPPLSAPPPTAGADLPPSRAPEQQPHFGFPLQPTFGFAAPPVAGEGYPFIGSNPTVPLPTGMTDTATVLPLPDAGAKQGMVGYAASVQLHITMIALAVIFSTLFLSKS